MNPDNLPDNFLADIDRELKMLEDEKAQLEAKYGFSEQFSEAKTVEALNEKKKELRKLPNLSKEQKRYNYEKLKRDDPANLIPSTRVIKPEIAADWVSANSIAPDLMTFYDEDSFHRQVWDKDSFQISSEDQVSLEGFDEYMSNMALL